MAAKIIKKDYRDVIITSKQGKVIKLPVKDLPTLTRQTQGVILIRLSGAQDYVVAVTATKKETEKEEKKVTSKTS
jgi:DNA gyrase/topoisomerase IV subunit A